VRVSGRALLAAFALLAGGCTSLSYYVQPSESGHPTRPHPPLEPVRYVYPEDPPIGDLPALERLLSNYQHQGQVVLVDFWSIRNPRSRDRCGLTIDLARKFRPYGLQCVGVLFDHAGLWQTDIAPFLRSVGCSYPCVLVPSAARAEVIAELGYEWNGTLPAILLFDRDGGLAAEIVETASPGEIEQITEEVLKGQRPPVRTARSARGGVSARARMLDLGTSKTLAASNSEWPTLGDLQQTAQAIANRCEVNIDWSNARVAVLPFTILGRVERPDAGKELADAVAKILAARHPEAMVDRAGANAALTEYEMTPLGVEYDPTTLASKTGWTHIITGTLRVR
jgi:hypothetical protein